MKGVSKPSTFGANQVSFLKEEELMPRTHLVKRSTGSMVDYLTLNKTLLTKPDKISLFCVTLLICNKTPIIQLCNIVA